MPGRAEPEISWKRPSVAYFSNHAAPSHPAEGRSRGGTGAALRPAGGVWLRDDRGTGGCCRPHVTEGTRGHRRHSAQPRPRMSRQNAGRRLARGGREGGSTISVSGPCRPASPRSPASTFAMQHSQDASLARPDGEAVHLSVSVGRAPVIASWLDEMREADRHARTHLQVRHAGHSMSASGGREQRPSASDINAVLPPSGRQQKS